MIRVIHKECGDVAFHIHKKWETGEPIHASNVVLLNGETPDPSDRVVCCSCGEPFIPGDRTVIQQHWTDWFVVK